MNDRYSVIAHRPITTCDDCTHQNRCNGAKLTKPGLLCSQDLFKCAGQGHDATYPSPSDGFGVENRFYSEICACTARIGSSGWSIRLSSAWRGARTDPLPYWPSFVTVSGRCGCTCKTLRLRGHGVTPRCSHFAAYRISLTGCSRASELDCHLCSPQ